MLTLACHALTIRPLTHHHAPRRVAKLMKKLSTIKRKLRGTGVVDTQPSRKARVRIPARDDEQIRVQFPARALEDLRVRSPSSFVAEQSVK